MTVTQINLTLKMTAALLAVAAVATFFVGWIAGLEAPVALPRADAPALHSDAAIGLPSVESFSPIFSRSLRMPVSGAATVAGSSADSPPAAAAPAAPALNFALVGTLGKSIALIREPDGTIAMVEAGEDDINGAKVLAVRRSQVDLQVNGKVMTLRMPAPRDDSPIISRSPGN